MNIDEKLENNWYLEQDEIQTLIKRYTIMKYLNCFFTVIILALLLSCNLTTSNTPDFKIRSKLITFSETVPSSSIFAQFEEVSSGNIFLAKITKEQKRDIYVGWQGTLLLNKADGYLVVLKTIE